MGFLSWLISDEISDCKNRIESSKRELAQAKANRQSKAIIEDLRKMLDDAKKHLTYEKGELKRLKGK